MSDTWKDYIKPGLLVLVPVLFFIGTWLKKAAWFEDKFIPLVLGVLGVLLALLYTFGTSDIRTREAAFSAVFTAVTQGIACAGASVYTHQLIKQSRSGQQSGGEA